MVSQVKIRALLLEEGGGSWEGENNKCPLHLYKHRTHVFQLVFLSLLQQDENCLCSLIFESFLKYLGLVEFNHITAKAKFVKAQCT